MTAYSYSSSQLKKRTSSKKPFWSGKKIALAISASGPIVMLPFVVFAIASVPSVEIPAEVKTSAEAPQSPFIKADGEGYSCENQQSGDKLFTHDYKACEDYVNSYRCSIEENWSVSAKNAADCDAKQKEHIAKKNAEFDLDSYKEEYRNALTNIENETRPAQSK